MLIFNMLTSCVHRVLIGECISWGGERWKAGIPNSKSPPFCMLFCKQNFPALLVLTRFKWLATTNRTTCEVASLLEINGLKGATELYNILHLVDSSHGFKERTMENK